MTLLQSPWNGIRPQTSQAKIGIASLRLAFIESVDLDDESTALDGVDVDVTGFEVWVEGPGALEFNGSAAGLRVGFRVDVEEGDFADVVAGGVGGDGGDVVDAEAGGVGGLVVDSVDDVLVVVDGAGGAFVEAGLWGGNLGVS